MAHRCLRYVETAAYQRLAGELVVVDAGSRGGPFGPFAQLCRGVRLVGFEPADEAGPADQVPFALWKEPGAITLHLGVDPATSSVRPPDMDFLARFDPTYAQIPRVTARTVEVPCVSVDVAVDRGDLDPPAFMKVDTPSAELEVLQGAARSLAGMAGVLVDTWHAPAHAGQPLHGEVEALLNRHGFHLVDRWTGAKWRHATTTSTDRHQLTASNSLFLRDALTEPPATQAAALQAVAIADLFDFTGLAMLVARRSVESGALTPEVAAEVEADLRGLAAERHRRSRRGSPRRRLGAALQALRFG